MALRASELRLKKALRRIVILALAPAPVAAACHAASDTEPGYDASAEPPDAAAERTSERDAGAPDADAASCAPIPFDASAFDDGAAGCADFWMLPCGVAEASLLSACFPSGATCQRACGDGGLYYCQLAPVTCTGDGELVPDATSVVECVRCAVGGGRRPMGWIAARVGRSSPAGEYYASMAHLESASVRAFRDLSRWLAALGAPPGLVRAARRAQQDETRHARAAARIARRFGATPPRLWVRRVPPPSLVELLEDCAIEGCAGETFGALLATWQADHAEDARVRRTMRSIARDETRHAALAWEIWRWGIERAPPLEQARLRRALESASAALEHRAAAAVPEAARRVSGHPAPIVARRLARALARVVDREATRATRR